MSHIGVAGRLDDGSVVRQTSSDRLTHLAMTQPIVWTLQPWVSWMCRDFQRTTGPTIHDQNTCPNTPGYLHIG